EAGHLTCAISRLRYTLSVKVTFYRSSSGSKPVAEYLRSLDPIERARLADALYQIALRGLDESGVVRRQIEGKLWELKVSQHRAFYILITGDEMYVLHAYKKQGQKAPRA